MLAKKKHYLPANDLFLGIASFESSEEAGISRT